MGDTKTLDEHAETVKRLDAAELRRQRDAAHARVRELEAERAEAVRLGLVPDHPLTFGPGDNNVGRTIRKSDGKAVEDLTTQAYAERLVARGLGEYVPYDEPDR